MTIQNVAGVRIANIEIDPLRPTVFKLGDALEGCVDFRATVAHRAFVNCVIEDPLSGDYEIGEYRYDSGLNTLTRVSVTSSSNSGAAISPSKNAVIYQGTALAYIYARRLDVSADGYAAGAGDAKTQGTSKTTAVTINKLCGAITTHAASLTTSALFTVNNTTVAATDVVLLSIAKGAQTAGAYYVWVEGVEAGKFVIGVENVSGGALGEAIPINFAVIKAVAA